MTLCHISDLLVAFLGKYLSLRMSSASFPFGDTSPIYFSLLFDCHFKTSSNAVFKLKC